MKGPRHDLRQLAQLASLPDATLESSWRMALANLGRASAEIPTPLEGLDPRRLLASLRRVESAGLLEDLSWISGPLGAGALYQIASALPPSPQRDRIEADVARRLSGADAPTFIALATALAQGSQKPFATPHMRASVALCFSLPIGTQTRTDSLALALIARPDLARAWLQEPSQGALPARRMAAQLLELACRAGVKRLARGDESAMAILETPIVLEAWQRLLDDRESLVWKHVASARGLLSEAQPRLRDEIHAQLDPGLSPTEWRRAAASLAARIGVAPGDASRACLDLLESSVVHADPGVPAAMLLGMPRAAEAEPSAVKPLLPPLLQAGGVYAIEACLDLLDEGFAPEFGVEAMSLAKANLRRLVAKGDSDESQHSLLVSLLERIERPDEDAPEALLRGALHEFAERGIASATPLALRALERVKVQVVQAVSADLATQSGRDAALSALLHLEASLLRTSALPDLLSLLADDQALRSLEPVFDAIAKWSSSASMGQGVDASQFATLAVRRVRALLHLVDNDGTQRMPERSRARRSAAVRSLLNSLSNDHPGLLKRALLASAARAFEALVRDKSLEPSDVLVGAMVHLRDPADMRALADASMMPELEGGLAALAKLQGACAEGTDSPASRHAILHALESLPEALPDGHSPRTSALRQALLRTTRCLSPSMRCTSLRELVTESGSTALDDLVDGAQSLAQIVTGARMRLDPGVEIDVPTLGASVQALCNTLEQAVQEREPGLLHEPLERACATARAELPQPLASALTRPLQVLGALPLTTRRGSVMHLRSVDLNVDAGADQASLPDWLPPNRTLGNFYVMRAIGEGGGGSVFVVRRGEERAHPAAELLALKVPEYDGDAARALSEEDFLQMFREEAGALLAMPQDQPNLARFVTFDAGVKPKPILVMEYVEGPSLERLLARRHVDTAGAFDILLGIARGLAAMHAMGVAHLDVKPSNVILRDFWSGAGLEPVLVDFGLTGRRLRPGCCTANYGAPEIWGDDTDIDPRPADIYAFGCLAFEVLTGKRLFEAPSLVSLIGKHTGHDGNPELLAGLFDESRLEPLARSLTGWMRHAPESRSRIDEVQRQLETLKALFADSRWPLASMRGSRARHG